MAGKADKQDRGSLAHANRWHQAITAICPRLQEKHNHLLARGMMCHAVMASGMQQVHALGPRPKLSCAGWGLGSESKAGRVCETPFQPSTRQRCRQVFWRRARGEGRVEGALLGLAACSPRWVLYRPRQRHPVGPSWGNRGG